MADKKPRAKVGSKSRPSIAPRILIAPGVVNAPIIAAAEGKPDGVSSWGTLTAAEVPVEEMPAPAAPPVPLNVLGLPDNSLLEKKSVIEEELGGITERLHRALGEIATLYDENGEVKLEPEIDHERRQYMARLEALDERFRSIEGDREQLLRSLNGNGGPSDTFQVDEEHERELPSPLSSLRERMATTQSGYQKLRDLNQQMLMIKRQGKQEEADLENEVDIQAKVISRFKEMLNARKTKAVVDRSFGSHWKHAAGEIVGLLAKVRQEGQTDIETMKRTLENTEQLISKQVKALARLEERVYEKQEEINKCKNDFSMLENDNVLLESEVNQYRSQVVELKKKIRNLEAQMKDATTSDATEAESDDGARTRRVPETITVAEEPAAGLASDVRGRRTFKKQPQAPDVKVVKEENEKLIDKVTSLEMKVIEKETKNIRMEHDVSEMLENIRSTSPEAIRHLGRSIDLTKYLPDAEINEDDDPSKEMAIDVAGSVSPRNDGIHSTPTITRSYSISPRSKSKSAKRPGTRTPAQIVRDLRHSSQKIDDRTECAEGSEPTLADFNREREHCTRLASELEAVKKELARAKREIVGLQFGSKRTYAISTDKGDKIQSGGKETNEKPTLPIAQPSVRKEEKPAERVEVPREWQRRRSSIQPPNVAKLLAKVSPYNANKPSDEKTLYEQLKAQGLHNADPRRNVRVIRTPMSRKTTVTIAGHEVLMEEEGEGGDNEEEDEGRVKGEGTLDDEGNVVSFEEYIIVDQGMQTDPVLDPLGAWSNVKTVGLKARRRSASPRRRYSKSPVPLPAPPEEWAQFDPTPIKGPLGKMEDRAHEQKKGGRSRPGSAVEVFFFVERELSRIITGIRGFTSYVSQLLHREVSEIAEMNDEIRKQMSERSLRRVERMVCGNEQQDDHGLSGKPAVPPIRRGRFELVRQGNQMSNFASRGVFANYTTGRRSSIVPGAGTASESETSNVADYYHLFLPIIEHLQGADAEAQRRLVDELRSGKRTMTSCQRWNLELELIGKHAIDVLRGICEFFRNTVDQQTREHEVLTEGIKMKEEIEYAFRGALPGHTLAGDGLHPPTLPVQSKSLSSIESSHRYLPSLMIPGAHAPTNKDEMKVAKTVLPRKGMIRLQAAGTPEVDNKTADQKKGHRPAPQNHRKLLTKQKNALRRASDGTAGGAKEPPTLNRILLELKKPGSVPRRGKEFMGKEVRKKNTGAFGQQGISNVLKAAKRQLNVGEQLRGKLLNVFSN